MENLIRSFYYTLFLPSLMDSNKDEVVYEFLPYMRTYKDGRIERLIDTEIIPPSVDPQTGVSSKDVVVIPEFNVSARLYLPTPTSLSGTDKRVPLLVYFHGGGFCTSSAFSPWYHNYLNSLVAKAGVVAVSVDYRLAPEHFVPAAFEDSWNALKWVGLHSKGDGPEPWLNQFADFDRVFLAGESAGATIASNMALLAGDTELNMKLLGILLVHPYFWGSEPIGSEASDPGRKALVDSVWPFVCPSNPSNDDPRLNPVAPGAPTLSKLGCSQVLVCIAEKDIIKDRGILYYETLAKTGWKGAVEIVKTEGEDHIFHLFNPTCENAELLLTRLASFLNPNTTD